MKQCLLLVFTCFLYVQTTGQNMQVKQYNCTTFSTDEKYVSPILEDKSSEEVRQHREYGILPYNVQCTECVELIDRRTATTRFFIHPQNAGHTYSQSSYFPLHYRTNENGIWQTIDPRLRPQQNGVYAAPHQPVPTKCDLNRQSTSITERGFEFEFNKNLTLHFVDEQTLYTQPEPGNYTQYSIGEEGLRVTNMWNGIDMEQQFSKGEIKTSYVIKAPLSLPVSKGWMIIEDHFTLPEGYTFQESPEGQHTENGYIGNYLLKNASGETLLVYEKPVYLDAKAWGMHGEYRLMQSDRNFTLQMLVPIAWLNNPDNTYPLVIDPLVNGVTKFGDFAGQGTSANMGFTSMALGSCDYNMIVNVPGKSTLTNVYVDVEYSLTYDNACGNPPLSAPYCTFSQVSMEIVNNTCGTSTGLLSCSNSNPPFTGTCTTDPAKVTGAQPINVVSIVPNFLSCLSPQCPDFMLPFTLKNRDSVCLDQCGYLCARGHMWQITVEARTIEGSLTRSAAQVCPGDTLTLTAHAAGGVPPFMYLWTLDGGNTYDTTYSPTYVLLPTQDFYVDAILFDNCGEFTSTNIIDVNVFPAPVVQLVNDTLIGLCDNCSFQWYLNDSLLPGDTLDYFIPQVPGYYKLKTIDENGCEQFSNIFPYLVSALFADKAANASIIVVPNPNDGNFAIKFLNGMKSSVFSLRITDLSGRLIDERTNLPFSQTYVYHSVEKIPAGVYVVEIDFGNNLFKQRMVINP